MPDRAIRFNGRVVAASGLALAVGRNYATTDKTGAAVPAGQPVFDERGAYLAAPAAPTIVASVATGAGATMEALGAGVDADGVTPVVVTLRTPGTTTYTIGIHVGQGWAANAFDAAANSTLMEGTGNRSVIRSILSVGGDLGGANKAGGNRADLLRGVGAGFGEDANWRYEPLSAIVAHGLVLIWCRAVFWTGSVWETRASALCAWDDIGGRFYLVNRMANANPGVVRGSIWNNSAWTARGSNGQTDRINRPTDVWTACVDYQNNPSSGTEQATMIARATRADVNSRAWTVLGTELVRRTSTAANQHDHSAFVYFGTDASVHVVLCRGHQGNNAVWRISRASEAGWNSGPASSTDGATANGWTTQATFSGDPAANMDHNQYMSVAPVGANPFEWLVTQDIGPTPISVMTLPTVAGTSKAVFNPLRVRNAITQGGYLWENFGLWAQDHQPPRSFVMLMDGQDPGSTVPSPGSGLWGAYAPVQKVCWSPNGTDWGQLFAWTNVRAGRGVPNGANVICNRTTSTTLELVQVGIPPMLAGRPLLVSPATSNFADGVITQSDAPSAGNTVTDVTATYLNAGFVTGRSIPRCPTGRNVYRYTNTGATSNYGGEHFITPSGLTVTGARVKVKVWMYVLPPAEPFVNNTTAPYNVPRPNVEYRFRYGTGASTFGSGSASLDGGGWIPVTFEMDASSWTTTSGRLLMRLQCSAGVAKPCDVLISVESVTAGAQAELPSTPPPASTGSGAGTTFTDHLISTGWNPSANWSFLIALQNPDDGGDIYDQTTRPNAGTRRLFTLVQSLGSGQTRTLWAILDLGANDRITFTDGTNTVQLTAPTDQDFEWGRSTQLGIGISRASNGDMVFAAFMGGTLVATATANWTQDIRPNSVHHADLAQGPVEPHSVHLVRIDEDNARNSTALADWLRSSSGLASPSSGSRSTILVD
jgi:hypothetical protein